ncbi:hypothetical protein FVQ98_01205 [Ottowia sp. GY511]|uniref:hypothetical protein n=1 Tax=Ottowia sp. GY511 TaxID=2603274 RepID=UPI0011D609BE|nr:hypothetical protein [Ottowia sp. GY511]TXK33524.1 hypothetical protein FVQ98_01205 [Ottowia sp. GY511]
MQEWIVAVIVALAALYVVWRFLPRTWRQQLGDRLGWRGAADSGACSSCADCSGCGPKSPSSTRKST